MKRDDRLIPLSWGHHAGLVFARRLRVAVHKETEPLETLIDKLRRFWEDDLNAHFEAEEDVLVPAVRESGGNACDDEIARMMREHLSLRNLRDELPRASDRDVQAEGLKRFAELLTQHIRFEERELFEKAQRILTPDVFDRLGEVLIESLPEPKACAIRLP